MVYQLKFTEALNIIVALLPPAHSYIPVRYLQAMGTFEFASQLYRNGLRFYYNCSKEVCGARTRNHSSVL